MLNWEKILKERSYIPEGSGSVLDYYDAERVALIAYIEGMEMYNSIMKEWSDSDDIDAEGISQKVNSHIEYLKKRFNIAENGRELPTNSSM